MPSVELSYDEIREIAFCLRAVRNKKRKEADRDDYQVVVRVQAEQRVGRIDAILRSLKALAPLHRDLDG